VVAGLYLLPIVRRYGNVWQVVITFTVFICSPDPEIFCSGVERGKVSLAFDYDVGVFAGRSESVVSVPSILEIIVASVPVVISKELLELCCVLFTLFGQVIFLLSSEPLDENLCKSPSPCVVLLTGLGCLSIAPRSLGDIHL